MGPWRYLTALRSISIGRAPFWPVLPSAWGAGSKASEAIQMKNNIHPNYRPATIECSCGNIIENRSTRGSFTVEVCSACHPFYTGKQKLMDTAGRIDKFRKKYAKQLAAKAK